MTTRDLKIRIDQIGNAVSGLKSLAGGLGKVGLIAGGAALAGVAALGAGIAGVSLAGLSMNNSMEQATAKINAFTKDSAKTAEILEMVRERAAKTPFEFNAMAQAASALLPSAKMAQTGLEDLIEQAEILAASNPAEGLEGAAFALKEAVSGDFTSIIERFNLPRQFINQLKEEGVPNLEIVSRAMQELGLDTDLVSALANTAEGRWSTFKDMLQNVASTVTKPIFDKMSSGLGRLNELLEQNEPAIQAMADVAAGALTTALEWLGELVPKLVAAFNEWAGPTMQDTVKPALMIIDDALRRIAAAFGINTSKISGQDMILKAFKATLGAVTTAIQVIAIAFRALAVAVEAGKRAIEQTKAAVNSLKNTYNASMSSIRSGIDSAISKWNSFKSAVRNAVDVIPDWLIPHSPTPFEIGLRGIASATQAASNELNRMPVLPSSPGALAPPVFQAAAAGGAGGPITINLTYAPAVSTADRFELERVLTDVVRKIVRGG